MATYQILFWHGIPAQIRVRHEGERISRPLSPRFLNAIDNAAMAAGLTASDAYSAGFEWSESIEFDAEDKSLEDLADAIVEYVEEQYANIDWRQIAEHLRPQTPEPDEEDAEQDESSEDEDHRQEDER